MTIVGVHHVQLAMPAGEEELARDFYGGVLGLVEVEKPEDLRARGGCWFKVNDELQLHLGVEDPFRPATKAHPALIVASLGDVRAHLEAYGSDIVLDTHLEGFSRFYTADPFGNRLELMARIGRGD